MGDCHFSLLQIWLIGVVYVIVSEGLSVSSEDYYLPAMRFLYYSNDFLILGYLLNFKVKNRMKTDNTNYQVGSNSLAFTLILLIVYVIVELPRAIVAFQSGRSSVYYDANYGFIHSITGSIALVIPAMSAYYSKSKGKSIWRALILSMPVFILLFLKGNRFPLLFSLASFLIVSGSLRLDSLKMRNMIWIFIVFVLVNSGANMMEQFRVGGIDEIEVSNDISSTNNDAFLSQKIASYMSPEGVIQMMDLNMKYFNNHPHTNGVSITFPLYFWIPRFLWPSKPTMIGNWLVRTARSGFSEGHSASFGFVGEAYADFGVFSLIVVFLLGFLIRSMELYKNELTRTKSSSPKQIMAAMFYPYTFFIVRSPVTATTTLIGIYAFYYLFTKTLVKNKEVSYDDN